MNFIKILTLMVALVVFLFSSSAAMAQADPCYCQLGENGKCGETMCTFYGWGGQIIDHHDVNVVCYDTSPPTNMTVTVHWVICYYNYAACTCIGDENNVTVTSSGVSSVSWNGETCLSWSFAGGSFDSCGEVSCIDFEV